MATEQSTGPTPEGNRKLSTEAANWMLSKIIRVAQGPLNAEDTKHLADAYATLVAAMPQPEPVDYSG